MMEKFKRIPLLRMYGTNVVILYKYLPIFELQTHEFGVIVEHNK